MKQCRRARKKTVLCMNHPDGKGDQQNSIPQPPGPYVKKREDLFREVHQKAGMYPALKKEPVNHEKQGYRNQKRYQTERPDRLCSRRRDDDRRKVMKQGIPVPRCFPETGKERKRSVKKSAMPHNMKAL